MGSKHGPHTRLLLQIWRGPIFWPRNRGPKNGLEIRTRFCRKQTLSNKLGLGLGHHADARPSAGSSHSTAQITLTTRVGWRRTMRLTLINKSLIKVAENSNGFCFLEILPRPTSQNNSPRQIGPTGTARTRDNPQLLKQWSGQKHLPTLSTEMS